MGESRVAASRRTAPALTVSTAHRRTAAALVLALGVVTAVAGLLVARSESGTRAEIVERFDTRQVTAVRFLDAYIQQALAGETSLATATLSGQISQTRLDEITQENQFSTSTLLDAQGRALAVSPVDPASIGQRLDLTDSALGAAVHDVPAVTTIGVLGTVTPVVEYAVPFQTYFGRRVFAGGYLISNTPLQPFVSSALSSIPTGHAYLVDENGVVIACDQQQDVGFALKEVSASLDSAIGRRDSGDFGSGEQKSHYISGSIAGTPWKLVYSLSDDELYKGYGHSQIWWPWVELAAVVLLGLGIIVLFIRALADRAQAIAGRTQALDDHARQEAILDTTSDAFIGMDDRGFVVDWNTAAGRLLGWTRDEALGQPVSTLMIPPRDQNAHSNGLREFLTNGVPRLPSHPINLTARHRDGHEIPIELTVSRTHWQGSWRFHAFMRDITERVEHEHQLQELALTDPLTALANRRAFLDNLDQAHARARRHHGRLAVLYADVDHFKSINDTYGHAAGDAILVQIADRLRGHFRTEDTIGRLGGDEFAVVCEDFTSQPEQLVARVREVLADPYSFRGQPIMATVSVGLASPGDDESTEHLLERADTVMYRAKAARHAE